MTRNDPSVFLPSLPEGSEILVARLRSLGDIVLETPCIAALHQWRSDLRICVLVEPRFAAVLAGNPAISELIASCGLGETARSLRRRLFPAVYNQHGGPRSALLTAFSGSPRRVGWKGFQFSWAYNVPVPDAMEFYGRPFVHTVEHRISQLYFTGLPRGPIPRAQVFPQPDAIRLVELSSAQEGIAGGSPYAVLQPGGRTPAMRWPPSKFAEVARWLRSSHGIETVVNLGAGDLEIALEVRRQMQGCARIAELLPLSELVALLAGARLFVGNDSGPAHIAAAVGKPCAVIFGPTNPVQWHPWQVEHRVIETGAEFRPVRGDKCVVVNEPRPVQSIEVEEVRKACAELLAAVPPPATSAATGATAASGDVQAQPRNPDRTRA